jgi:hypothetical protein
MVSPLPESFQLGGHGSKSGASTLHYGSDLPDYCSPSINGSLDTPHQGACSVSEAQEHEITSSEYEPVLDVLPTCDSFDPNVGMREKMEKMDRELAGLKSTIEWMQGVQDTQNRAISRLLIFHRRNNKVAGSYV